MKSTSAPVILMADDDPDDRLLARDAILECSPDKEIQFVENGEELMNLLHRRAGYEQAARPGLILLDLNMPLKDGRDALREIRADPDLRRIPVVVFTTSQADTDVGALYELGANSFITKPFQFETLVSVMRAIEQYWFKTVELPPPRQRTGAA